MPSVYKSEWYTCVCACKRHEPAAIVFVPFRLRIDSLEYIALTVLMV